MTMCRKFWLASFGVLSLACSKAPTAGAVENAKGEQAADAEKVARPALDIVPGSISERAKADGATPSAIADPPSTSSAPEAKSTSQKVEPLPSATFGIQTREHQLWLLDATEPRLFTVRSRDGTVLAERIDDERLARDYPELHEMYEGGVDAGGYDAVGY